MDDPGSIAQIRQYLKEVAAADTEGSRTGTAQHADGRIIYEHEKDQILTKILNGELDITTISYNALAGTHSGKDEKTQLADDEWQRMTITADNGKEYRFDLNSRLHSTLLHQRIYNGDGKAQMLAEVGMYTYIEPKSKNNIGNHLAPEGIKVSLDGDGVAVTGKIYSWDKTNNTKIYKDINDFLPQTLLQTQTPETIETEIDRIMNVVSVQMYAEYNPIVE